MSWNNAIKTFEFKREQGSLRKMYLKNGMTEDQMNEMYLYDKANFLHERNENEHIDYVCSINDGEVDEDGEICVEQFDVPYYDEYDPFIVGFESDKLNLLIGKLKGVDLEIIKLLYIEFSQQEIAEKLKISQSTVSRKIKKFKKILDNL